MKKKFSFLLFAFFVFGILVTGCGNKNSTTSNQSNSGGQKAIKEVESGSVTCSACHGSGNLGACGCENGYMRIGGRKVICSFCHGTGVTECWKCHGKGGTSAPQNNHSSGKIPNTNPKVPYGGTYDNNTGKNAAVDDLCPVCHGSGTKICSSCHGSGSLSQTKYAPSYGTGGDTSYTVNITCKACNGSGQMKCISCGGSGHLR